MSPTIRQWGNIQLYGRVPKITSRSYGPSFQSGGLAGLERVVRNLQIEIDKIKGATLRGLVRGALLVREDMDNTSPLIPVDIGNMRASFFMVASDGTIRKGASPEFRSGPGDTGRTAGANELEKLSSEHSRVLGSALARAKAYPGLMVILGFGAYYAPIVHEMMGSINWSRHGSGPKFFQAAFRRNKAAILAIIKEEAARR